MRKLTHLRRHERLPLVVRVRFNLADLPHGLEADPVDALAADLCEGGIYVRAPLAALLAPGGVALLVTDLTGNDTYPLDMLPPDADLGAVMSDLLHTGNVIHAAHPGRLSAEIRRNPELAAGFAVRPPIGPWLWHNGPDKTFLVYALEITAKPR
jgi:hypothetical protein